MHSTKPSHQAHNNFNLPNHPIQYIGITSLALLSLMTLALVFPFVSNNSSATTYPIDTNQSIAVALDEEAVMDITPSSTGTKGSSTTRLKVSSNRSSGYKVYLSTMDSTNAMVNVSDSTKPSIQALPMSSTKADFAANTWGYALTTTEANDSTTFSAVPTTSTMVADRPAKDEDNLYLTFAASIDTSLPAGQYANSVLVSVVANPLAITDLTNMVYMQDMQPEFCANTKGANGLATITPGNEVTKQLIDSRDGKEYWVAKLADGNCWMTQNLALDLVEGEKLTSVDTDLNSTSEWIVPKDGTTNNFIPSPTDFLQSQYQSWNLGQYVLATPDRAVSCNSAPTNDSSDDKGTNALRPNQTLEQNCSDFVNVSGSAWQSTYNSSKNGYNKTWTGTNYNSSTKKKEPYTYNGLVAVNKSNSTYDAHYLLGNYYLWGAATAGSGVGLVSTGAEEDVTKLKDAPDSICPKGWQMPTTGRNTSTGLLYDRSKSFYRLLFAYGYPAADKYANANSYTRLLKGIAGTGVTGQAHQNLAESPMYFVRGGIINLVTFSLSGAGIYNDMSTSTAFSTDDRQYYFGFTNLYIRPASAAVMGLGYSVRCISR